MLYYDNEKEERNERNWFMFKIAVVIAVAIAFTIGYFVIDFEKIDNDIKNNIKTEKNE